MINLIDQTMRYINYVNNSYVQDVKSDWNQAGLHDQLHDRTFLSRVVELRTEGALIAELTAIAIAAIAISFIAGTVFSLLLGISVKAGLLLIAPVAAGIHSYLYYSNSDDISSRFSRIFFERLIPR